MSERVCFDSRLGCRLSGLGGVGHTAGGPTPVRSLAKILCLVSSEVEIGVQKAKHMLKYDNSRIWIVNLLVDEEPPALEPSTIIGRDVFS